MRSGWFSVYCHTHPAGGHLGTRLWPPQLQAWGWKLLRSIPSCWTSGRDRFHVGGQCLDNHFQTTAAGDVECVDLHAHIHGLMQGRMSISKVTLWYRAPGRFGPAGQGVSDREGEVCKWVTQLWLGKVTAREEMPQRNLPFPQGTNLPRNTTAGKTTLPKLLREEGSPVGISLLLVNSSLLRALRKTQPTARRPGLKQVPKACYARRRVRRAAPRRSCHPPPEGFL